MKKYQDFAVSLTGFVLYEIYRASIKVSGKITRKYLIESLDNKDFDITRNQISKTFYNLKKSKYIIEESDSVILTGRAKIKIASETSSGIEMSGKIHLISFDIPELMRQNRDNFRRTLKRIGFVQVQKSLWATNREVGELVEIAANEYKVDKYVAYFVADKTNIDAYLNKILEREWL